MKKFLLTTILIFSLLACSNKEVADTKQEIETKLYHQGNIITMEGDSVTYVEAVITEGGKIVYTGDEEGAKAFNVSEENTIDLEGKTLLPGFIDPHVHPVSLGSVILSNDIIAPHDWVFPHKTYEGVRGKENYLNALEEIMTSKVKDVDTIVWGYHQSFHGELTLDDIDRVSGDKPLIIWHRSTHEVFLNSAMAKKYGINKDILNHIPKEAWSQADLDNLHFLEMAYGVVRKILAPVFVNKEKTNIGMERLNQLMLMNGLTAIAEPGFALDNFDSELATLKRFTKNSNYNVYLIPGSQTQLLEGIDSDTFKARIKEWEKEETDKIKFLDKQVKMFADGAIYSLAMQMNDGYLDGHHGEWIFPQEIFEMIFKDYWKDGYKIVIHVNGDLGLDFVLDVIEKAKNEFGETGSVASLQHLGYFTPEQAKRMASLGAEASANPYYLWALSDIYSTEGLGSDRAQSLVRIKSLIDNGIPTSFHSDFAMAPIEPLRLASTAINRISADGNKYSQEEKISVFDGIKGITIEAAKTLNLQDEIGSIKEGKKANFTILAENPFEIDTKQIEDIHVEGIVFEGKLIKNNIN